MRPLRYSINVTLDGCCDHRTISPSEELHRYHAANLERADALLFGRVTYQMMEEAWRQPATGTWPDWMPDWMIPFARTIDGAKKYVVSGDEYEFLVQPVIAGHGADVARGSARAHPARACGAP